MSLLLASLFCSSSVEPLVFSLGLDVFRTICEQFGYLMMESFREQIAVGPER